MLHALFIAFGATLGIIFAIAAVPTLAVITKWLIEIFVATVVAVTFVWLVYGFH